MNYKPFSLTVPAGLGFRVGISNQQFVITSANNLANNLSNVLESLMNASPSFGKGKGKGQPGFSLPDIIKNNLDSKFILKL